MQTGERKKGRKEKKRELLKILSKEKKKKNLHCAGAFIRMPLAFFLLSLPDTGSYAQADCGTLSGHRIVLPPDGSLHTPACRAPAARAADAHGPHGEQKPSPATGFGTLAFPKSGGRIQSEADVKRCGARESIRPFQGKAVLPLHGAIPEAEEVPHFWSMKCCTSLEHAEI